MTAATADVLERAADILERNGWIQGDYFDRDQLDGGRGSEDCAVCARGAINTAASGDPLNDYHPDGNAADDAMVIHLGTVLTEWNDQPGRTAAEVIEALRGAAAAERERT